ncbi:MAG: hypothetical protein GY795_01350 [Desulfobacterales bacterium]|nr:hypothetical protein [Desulfobacterales bacterium]
MDKKVTAISAVIFTLTLISAAHALTETKIVASDRAKGDRFGRSVSVSGDYAIAGAYEKKDDDGIKSGAAYVFKREGNAWKEAAKLVSISHSYFFGHSVSINSQGADTYAIVGAFRDESAYIFRENGTQWTQEAILTADDGEENDYFGWSVAVSDNYAVVGAYRDGNESGSVCIFKRNGTAWIRQAKLTADDGEENDCFGRSVAISGNYVVVGAQGSVIGGESSAYVFKLNGTDWIQQAKIEARDSTVENGFGFSVSVSADGSVPYAIVGAGSSYNDKGEQSGAAYIFKLEGNTWVQDAKLTDEYGTARDLFGRSVSVSCQESDCYAIVGADSIDFNNKNSGAAYIFKRNGNSWVQQDKLAAYDGASEDRFGWSVGISARGSDWYAVAGADSNDEQGAAYIYSNMSLPDIEVTPTKLEINRTHTERSGRSSLENREQEPDPSSDLNSSDQEYATGLIIPESVIDYWKTSILPPRKPAETDLPSSADWSRYDSPAKNQQNCGSCWAFASAALIENLANRAGLFFAQDISEQTITSCSVGSCFGGWYWDAFNYIYKNGISSESCNLYDISALKDDNCQTCISPDYLLKIRNFTPSPGLWGEDQTVNDLREALQNGPLVVSMRVPDDGTFNSGGYQGGIYDYKGGFISWDENGHAVLLVGYDDNLQCFKVKNSWGPNWGESGYFRIAYNDVTDFVKFGSYACSASGVYLVGEPVTVTNTGASDLIIKNISADKPWLTFSPQVFSSVPSNGSQVITVSVTDWNAVGSPEDSAEITIGSNDPDEPLVIVEVRTVNGVSVPPKPVLLVSPPFYEFTADKGKAYIEISNGGEKEMTWSAETYDSWIDIVSGRQGTDNGTIIFEYEANDGVERRGTVKITALEAEEATRYQTVEIKQVGLRVAGDINNDGTTGIADAVLVLKILAGISVELDKTYADVSGDDRIGMEEAIYALVIASGITR